MGKTQDSEYLSTISPRDQKFVSKKLTALEVAELYRMTDHDGHEGFIHGKRTVMFDGLANRMDGCNNWNKFAQLEDGSLKLIDARFCKVPNCPTCQWRRSLVSRAKFFSQLPKIQEKYPKHNWLFLTLTLKNCKLDDLNDTVRLMSKSFKRMRDLVDFPLLGWVRSLEVTRVYDWYDAKGNFIARHGVTWFFRSKDKKKWTWTAQTTDEVHPHYHVLAIVSPSYFSGSSYLSQKRWSEIWSQSLRVDYPTVVHIKRLKAKETEPLLPDLDELWENSRPDLVRDPTGIFTAICETMKYTIKEQDLLGDFCKDKADNSSWLKRLTEQMYKMRRIEFGGILKEFGKGISEEASKTENLIKGGDIGAEGLKVLREIEFKWDKVIKDYVAITRYVDDTLD